MSTLSKGLSHERRRHELSPTEKDVAQIWICSPGVPVLASRCRNNFS